MNNNDYKGDYAGCGTFIAILIALALSGIAMSTGDTLHTIIIVVSFIVFVIVLSHLFNKRKVNKYNKKFPGINITKKDIKRHVKLNEENRLLYIIASNNVLEIPFERITSYEWNEEDSYFKYLAIYTDLDNANLSIINFRYFNDWRYAEAKQILAYVIAHHDNNIENNTEEIEDSERNRENEAISDEELRKIIKEQNKRIEELEKNQKKSNNSDK